MKIKTILSVFAAVITAVTAVPSAGMDGMLQTSIKTDAAVSVSEAQAALSCSLYRYDGTQKQPQVTVTVDGCKLSEEDYSVSYKNNILPGTAQAVVTGKNSWQGTVTANFRITLPPPGAVGIKCTDKTAEFSWNRDPCATGYKLYRYDKASGKYIKCAVIRDSNVTSWTDKKVSSGCEYQYKIQSFVKSDGKYYMGKTSGVLNASVLPEKLEIVRVNRTKDAVRLYWNKVECDGYQVLRYYPAQKKWKKIRTIKNPDICNYRISDLSKGTEYKFKVRAYRYDSSGKLLFGSFCDVESVTTIPKITKKNGITYVEGIIIANKSYSLPSSYAPGLDSTALAAFTRMQKAAQKDGISLWICSGFRSYQYQASLYSSYVYYRGQAAADTFSARAGYSEHQTGLAMDINNASSSFEGTKEAKWLAEHCAEYGFIIRYPKGKESITGYKYEPWHIRYLGTTRAKTVTNSGLCLEEYLGITSQYK